MADLTPSADERTWLLAQLGELNQLLAIGEWRGEAAAALYRAQMFVSKLKADAEAAEAHGKNPGDSD